MFDANVRVWAGVWEVGGDQGDVRRSYGPQFESRPSIAMPTQWAGLIADTVTGSPDRDGPVLGDIADFTADFRDQYYGLVGAVSDSADGPPLITSGLIEPNECWWGRRSVRFAKQKYAAPRVDVTALSPALQRWALQRLVPKILIANQTRRIEAVIDPNGEWLPSVPVITCTTDRLDDVAEILHSDPATDFVRYHTGRQWVECDDRSAHRTIAGLDPVARSHGRDSHRRQLTSARIVIHLAGHHKADDPEGGHEPGGRRERQEGDEVEDPGGQEAFVVGADRAPSSAKRSRRSCMTARISSPAVSRDCTAGSAVNMRGTTDWYLRGGGEHRRRTTATGGCWSRRRARLIDVAGAERAGDQRLRRDGQRVEVRASGREQLDEHLVGGERRRVDVRGDERGRVPHGVHRQRAHREVAAGEHRSVANHDGRGECAAAGWR